MNGAHYFLAFILSHIVATAITRAPLRIVWILAFEGGTHPISIFTQP